MSPKEPTLNLDSALSAAEVAQYLKNHPDFFDRMPGVLADINVPHPQSGQAISLMERQAAVLRDRIKSMELKLAELLRHGQENDAIAASIQRWVRGLFLHTEGRTLPRFLTDSLGKIFSVPYAAIVIWSPHEAWADEDWASAPAADITEHVDALRLPLCGPVSVSPAARFLPEAGRDCQSIAVLPLRAGAAPEAFGVIVLGSPDARRFAPDLGVAFLERISEMASAALARVSAKTS